MAYTKGRKKYKCSGARRCFWKARASVQAREAQKEAEAEPPAAEQRASSPEGKPPAEDRRASSSPSVPEPVASTSSAPSPPLDAGPLVPRGI